MKQEKMMEIRYAMSCSKQPIATKKCIIKYQPDRVIRTMEPSSLILCKSATKTRIKDISNIGQHAGRQERLSSGDIDMH